MMSCTQTPRIGGLSVRVGPEGTGIRIPRMEAEEQRILLEEELLHRVDSRSENTWMIDLSGHADGATLALAEMLASFREEARRQGCEVKYTGLMRTGAACLAG